MNGKDELDYFPEETRELVGLTVVFSWCLVLFLALFVFFRCFFSRSDEVWFSGRVRCGELRGWVGRARLVGGSSEVQLSGTQSHTHTRVGPEWTGRDPPLRERQRS